MIRPVGNTAIQRTGIAPAPSSCDVGGSCASYVAVAIFMNWTPLPYLSMRTAAFCSREDPKAMTIPSSADVKFGRMAPCIGVRDIEAACLFYSNVLGFRKVFENGNPVGFIVLKKDDAELRLSQQ
jgi:hypothetical protein